MNTTEFTENDLSQDQQIALSRFSEWWRGNRTSNLFTLTGSAGTGKSSIANFMYENVGLDDANDILFIATTASAVQNIQQKTGGKNASTLASLIKQPDEYFEIWGLQEDGNTILVETWHGFDDINRSQVVDATELGQFMDDFAGHDFDEVGVAKIKNMLNQGLSVKRKFTFNIISDDKLSEHELNVQLVVIDELGMLTDEDLDTVKKFRVPVLGIGDPNQLPPIGGKMNQAILSPESDTHAVLTMVHRQGLDNPILDIATLARQETTLNNAPIIQRTVELQQAMDNGDTRLAYMPQIKRNASALSYADVILAGTNRQVQNYNQLVHAYRYGNASAFNEGEQLIITQNAEIVTDDSETPFINGQPARLVKIHDAENETDTAMLDELELALVDIEIDDTVYERILMNTWEFTDARTNAFAVRDRNTDLANNRKRSKAVIDAAFNPNYPEIVYASYGYAMTVHKAQGKEWDRVIFDTYTYPKMHDPNKYLYTGITRAKNQLIIM